MAGTRTSGNFRFLCSFCRRGPLFSRPRRRPGIYGDFRPDIPLPPKVPRLSRTPAAEGKTRHHRIGRQEYYLEPIASDSLFTFFGGGRGEAGSSALEVGFLPFMMTEKFLE